MQFAQLWKLANGRQAGHELVLTFDDVFSSCWQIRDQMTFVSSYSNGMLVHSRHIHAHTRHAHKTNKCAHRYSAPRCRHCRDTCHRRQPKPPPRVQKRRRRRAPHVNSNHASDLQMQPPTIAAHEQTVRGRALQLNNAHGLRLYQVASDTRGWDVRGHHQP
jgi:hypothetical protein